MPNHITNIITIMGNADDNKVHDILDSIKSDNTGIGSIDFNKLIKTPDNIFQGNLGKEEATLYGENNWLSLTLGAGTLSRMHITLRSIPAETVFRSNSVERTAPYITKAIRIAPEY